MTPTIRSFRAADRPAVRALACDTAERGEPVERFYPDRDVFADLLTRYYTDWEPASLWVAEQDGEVVGYLTGCLDTRRYRRVMAWRVVPAAILRGVFRGLLFRPETWRLAFAGIATERARGWRDPGAPERCPAHLHVNLRRDARGQRVGERLVQAFIQQARAAGVRGVHASVRGDNPPACRFFERLGFVPLGRLPVVFPAGRQLARHDTVIYGKEF